MPIPPVNPATPGVQLSALDIIKSALRMLNVLAAGEQPDAASANDALVILNNMLDGWEADDLMHFSLNILQFPFVAGQQYYTLGPGGNWDTVRPSKIDHMSLLNTQTAPQAIELPIQYLTDEQWAQVIVKNVVTPLPFHCYDDGDYPLRKLGFWGIPQENNEVLIYAWQPILPFASLATKQTFPPGYYRAMRYALAVELAPEFNTTPSPAVVALALEAIAAVKSNNVTPTDLKCDDGVTAVRRSSTPYSWITGW